MKSWIILSLLLVATSLHVSSAARCEFYYTLFLGYTCELNDVNITEIGEDLIINTDNHVGDNTDADVRHFEVNPDTVSLTFFPNSILRQFPNIHSFVLDTSGLKALTPFESCSGIEVMFIRHSFITNIPAGIFDACENLRVLDLSDNLIRDIHDDAFANLEQLLELDINENLLERISSRVFRNQVNLEEFNLRYNQISVIEDGAFSNLRNLITFYLRNNRLTEIRPEMFGDEISLVFFNLNENLLTKVPRLPAYAPRIKYIHLVGNQIENLEHDDFTFTYFNVTNIDLSQNRLRSLSADAFESLHTLDTLIVNNNEINAVDYQLFDRVTSLYTFYALNNRCVNVRFNNIRSIQQFDTINQVLERCYYNFFIPQTTVTCNFVLDPATGYTCETSGITYLSFRDKFNLTGEHIGLQSNDLVTGIRITDSNIIRLPSTIFSSFPNLVHVTVLNSQLVEIEEFDLCSKVQYFDLSDNFIRRLTPRSFEGCTEVEEIILDNNQITEIAPCTTFLQNVYQAKKLSLRNNICVDQVFESNEPLYNNAEYFFYPFITRCFSLWYLFLDSLPY